MDPDQTQKKEPYDYDAFKEDTSSLEVVEEGRPQAPISAQVAKRKRIPQGKLKHTGIVILLVIVILGMIASGIFIISKKRSDQPTNNITINTQSLDNGTLNQLTGTTEGGNNEQLTISANTIFKNNAVVQGTAEVAKSMVIQDSLDVRGPSTLRGAVTVGNTLNVGTNLTVNGLITAASLNVGSITISSINISGNLAFNGHLQPGGATPTARAGSAAGGGSVTISGNDTSGTITIRTGGSPSSGELAIIDFRSDFGTTPRVQLTPVNEAGSGIRYFATKSPGFFTVNTPSTVPANTTYIFDYLVTQ